MEAARSNPVSAVPPEQDLPHLTGIGATLRQVFAAHFLVDCPHILEIGGHERPITDYLTHHPVSVTSVDPKTTAHEADTLNGRPCRVRHIPQKFQEITYDYSPGSYGLVLLGYSLKPFGRRDPLGEQLFSLIDNAGVVVIEYAPALERATSQVPQIISRPSTRIRTTVDLHLHDPEIAGTPYGDRRFYVLDPVAAS
ncbi:hypothetical protein JJB09_16605 [Rhizobium sp. KVB221]|uniref:Class I SAM-dependent methyltransferase n=1 Tax=Rhizobium setariae TaxID=2801340 RepID=A0A936YV20_9HYPH|nr:hypothetical protein [Rhizobium setariae]MBL0373647.1 hypothetical protein [Rhizobium setariae]